MARVSVKGAILVATLALMPDQADAFLVPVYMAPSAQHCCSPGARDLWATRGRPGDSGGAGQRWDSSIRPLYVAESVQGAEAPAVDLQRGHFYGYGKVDHVPSILQNITAQRYRDVAAAKEAIPEADLREQIRVFQEANGETVDLFERVASEGADMAIAAEFKRASPSKGDIAVGVNAGEQGTVYASAGAAVLSVLTEPKWFKGSLEDMKQVRLATQDFKQGKIGLRPVILRKDFIVDEYQLLEARAHGADTVLLIVAMLEVDRLDALIHASRGLGMEPLVEVHTDEEMRIALKAGARVVGVNNRNLHTFKLDLKTTERVSVVASDMGVTWRQQGSGESAEESSRIILSALSGITGPEDVQGFANMGVSMVLVGETLMRADDPAKAIRMLLGKEDVTMAVQKHLVKVCGITSVEDALAAAAAGANLIGVIFAEGSPRRVSTSRAQEIAHAVQAFGERNAPKRLDPPPETDVTGDWFGAWAEKLVEATRRTPLVVGVFQNQPTKEIRRTVEEAGLDLVQLHGDEGIEACSECGVPGIRVIHVPGAREAGETPTRERARSVLDQLRPNFAAGVLLDTTIKGVHGGTGATFDHEVAKLVGEAGVPVIVAGGLDADNVGGCVSATNSFGVDVSSGVEQSKGNKDLGEVERFVAEARKAQKGHFTGR